MLKIASFTHCLILLLLVIFIPSTSISKDKGGITPDEIINKHLQSIGTEQSRAAITSRLIIGDTTAIFHANGIRKIEGRAALASEGIRNVIRMKFASPDYPNESVGFDGHTVRVNQTRPGIRTPLGDFLLTHDMVLKEGLMTGTLSAAWPLLNLSARNTKLEYAGIAKINNRQTYKLRYIPRKGSPLQVTLFFDTETYRHVRTEYERHTSDGARTALGDTRKAASHYKMIEDFSDFKVINGITLPSKYTLRVIFQTYSTLFLIDWETTLKVFAFNKTFDESEFKVEP